MTWTLLSCLQFFIILSCSIAVGTNLSQFICIGRFTAVSFQVLGHMKTILVLILGFIFFGKEGLNLHVILGMVIAVLGMMWYGNASSKPGGKERRSFSMPSNKSPKNAESTDLDEKNLFKGKDAVEWEQVPCLSSNCCLSGHGLTEKVRIMVITDQGGTSTDK
ncbi:hypothetical protein Pint_27027 [Pistacia integerrima]|uniref:Uncharacterized protein n=1 Tax=Pistacia integerrima TaxID=434235 RepID=A0ACC0YS68_9ROSI|nr:hypothetical protein Pint_27027 [Pistacia integerrima]